MSDAGQQPCLSTSIKHAYKRHITLPDVARPIMDMDLLESLKQHVNIKRVKGPSTTEIFPDVREPTGHSSLTYFRHKLEE